MLTELIKQRDPAYWEANVIDTNSIQRKDLIKTIIKNHPAIIPQ